MIDLITSTLTHYADNHNQFGCKEFQKNAYGRQDRSEALEVIQPANKGKKAEVNVGYNNVSVETF